MHSILQTDKTKEIYQSGLMQQTKKVCKNKNAFNQEITPQITATVKNLKVELNQTLPTSRVVTSDSIM